LTQIPRRVLIFSNKKRRSWFDKQLDRGKKGEGETHLRLEAFQKGKKPAQKEPEQAGRYRSDLEKTCAVGKEEEASERKGGSREPVLAISIGFLFDAPLLRPDQP